MCLKKMDKPKIAFFPPLTLVLCDSGRDNQLRVKFPPMVVIINKHKTTNSGVTTRHTRGQSNALMQNDKCRIECIRMHPLREDTQVPICASTKDGMAYSFLSFSPLGWQKWYVVFGTAGHRWSKMQSV